MKLIRTKQVACLLAILLLLTSFVGCITLVEPPYEPDTESDSLDTADTGDLESSTEEVTTETPTTEEPTTEIPTTEEPTTEEPTTETPTTEEPTTEEPTTEEATTDPAPPAVEKIKIYIDQGHNPHTVNTGAQGFGWKEEDITYAVGLELARLLSADPRFEVRLSRPTAETVLGTTNTESLQARCTEANTWGADYFISIHANSYTDETAHGAEAFAYSAESAAYGLGDRLLQSICAATGFTNRGMKIRNDLYVLKHTVMPAVLVELGFLSNPEEAALMGNEPSRFAAALYSGMTAYFFPEESQPVA